MWESILRALSVRHGSVRGFGGLTRAGALRARDEIGKTTLQ
jgi:hypothetical protein